MERAFIAAKMANILNKPVILDPVGAGASNLRTSAAIELLPLANVVRGNASEIIALSGTTTATKGVESTDPVQKAIRSAKLLAKTHNNIIVISGPEDFVTDQDLYQAALHATAYFGLCGQLTHQKAQAPAAFRLSFIDNLFNPDWDFFTHAAEGV